ncbi:MAG TPA: cobalt ECF transporter T component CbiQ [Acidimicrobiales bacterium]|nr:cobalt ECF transporter T component CbiQ [Acidimicrobiales bacterium]
MTSDQAPDWLLQPTVGLCPCGCIGKRTKGNYIAKTLAGGSRLMRQAMFADDVASHRGFLQRLDVRAKLVATLALLIGTAFVHSLAVMAGLYVATLAIAAASGLSLSSFVMRVWLFIPIFTGVIVIPTAIAHGPSAAALIVLRVAVSISLVVLLTLTTKWNRLLAGLRSLGVPRIFVVVLAMAYRYIFYLLGAVEDMYVARRARTTNAEDGATARRFVAASAGALFGKAYALADEVHQAMTARGYTGDVGV